MVVEPTEEQRREAAELVRQKALAEGKPITSLHDWERLKAEKLVEILERTGQKPFS